MHNRRMNRSLDRLNRMLKTQTLALENRLAGKGWQEPPYSWDQIKGEQKRYSYLQQQHWRRRKAYQLTQ